MHVSEVVLALTILLNVALLLAWAKETEKAGEARLNLRFTQGQLRIAREELARALGMGPETPEERVEAARRVH